MSCLSDFVNDYLNKVSKVWFDDYNFDRDVDYVKSHMNNYVGDDGQFVEEDFYEFTEDKFEEEFIEDLFNNWKNPKYEDYNFYAFVKNENGEYFADEVSSKDFYKYLKEYAKYCKEYDIEFDITKDDEETIWNKLAYWYAKERDIEIENKFVEEYVRRIIQKLDNREFRIECVLCYEKKQIISYCASCKDKCFCYECWDKTANNDAHCPFCRGIMKHNILLNERFFKKEKIEWINKMGRIRLSIRRNRK